MVGNKESENLEGWICLLLTAVCRTFWTTKERTASQAANKQCYVLFKSVGKISNGYVLCHGEQQ